MTSFYRSNKGKSVCFDVIISFKFNLIKMILCLYQFDSLRLSVFPSTTLILHSFVISSLLNFLHREICICYTACLVIHFYDRLSKSLAHLLNDVPRKFQKDNPAEIRKAVVNMYDHDNRVLPKSYIIAHNIKRALCCLNKIV
jgi:hypothetical protein